MHDDTDSLARWLTHYATCFVEDETSARKMLEIVAALRAHAQCAAIDAGTEGDLDLDDLLTCKIMGAVRLHTHDNTMAYVITLDVLAAIRALPQPEPVAWRWQVHGIYLYTGGYPVSGAEPLYLRDASNAR